MTFVEDRLELAELYFEEFGYLPTDIAFELASYGIDIDSLF